MAELFAHQGGWDEILFVAVPIALVAFLLWLANRRAASLDRDGGPAAPRDGADGGDHPHARPGREQPPG